MQSWAQIAIQASIASTSWQVRADTSMYALPERPPQAQRSRGSTQPKAILLVQAGLSALSAGLLSIFARYGVQKLVDASIPLPEELLQAQKPLTGQPGSKQLKGTLGRQAPELGDKKQSAAPSAKQLAAAEAPSEADKKAPARRTRAGNENTEITSLWCQSAMADIKCCTSYHSCTHGKHGPSEA